MADEPINSPQDDTAAPDAAPDAAPAADEIKAIKAQLAEFRQTNIEILKERDALKAQVGDLSAEAEKGRAAQTERQTLAERMEALETAIRAKDEQLQAEQAKSREQAKRDALQAEFLRRNGNDARAAADAAALAMGDWQIGEDGALKPTGSEYDAEGNKVTPAKYAESFLLERPHFAGRSTGDGRQGGDGRDAQGRRVVDPTDPVALGQYADEIASGDAVLADEQ